MMTLTMTNRIDDDNDDDGDGTEDDGLFAKTQDD